MMKERPQLRICFVSPHHPRECGIATFTQILMKNMAVSKENIFVVAISDKPGYNYNRRVIGEIMQDDEQTYIKAAEKINARDDIDVVSLQHVFSLFGGSYGQNIVTFLEHLKKPVVTTLHMVYPNRKKPSEFEVVDADYSSITEQVIRLSTRVVVIIQLMADLLMDQYALEPKKIEIIPHGSPTVKPHKPAQYKKQLGLGQGEIISSFGLIRPKKGLEYLIRAMPKVLKKYPKAKLLLLGESHPNRSPEYYKKLRTLAQKNGLLNRHIFFKSKYLTYREIIDYLSATDVFVTPYLVPEQTSSGAIAYALGCGKAIISTPFAYAKEVLSEKRGLFIKYRDQKSITEAIDFLFSHPDKRQRMEKLAYEYAKNSSFKLVAGRYLSVFEQVARRR